MDKVERQGLFIVLAGHFNPAIFNPDWIARRGVLEIEDAMVNIDVITPEYASFSVSDFKFEVTDERFVLNVLNEPFVKGGDIVAKIFGDVLPETPLSGLGINYLVHFRVDSWRQQRALGRLLAPIQHWEEWGMKLESDDLPHIGGLASISVEEKTEGDDWKGHFRVEVEPSRKLAPGLGVYVQTNDHYQITDSKSDRNLATLCAEQITESISRSRRIVNKLIAQAMEFEA